MSLKSWKKEFYSNPKTAANRGPKSALRHSIRKWDGLMKKNLKKHEVVKTQFEDLEYKGNILDIDSTSCALCILSDVDGVSDCDCCPIVEVIGENCMDHGEWLKWKDGDPHPMRRLLRKVYKEKYGESYD